MIIHQTISEFLFDELLYCDTNSLIFIILLPMADNTKYNPNHDITNTVT